MSDILPEEEFFIGWKRDLPPLQRRFLYHRLIGIFVLVFSLGLLIPYMQKRYEPSFYQYMSKETVEGVFLAEPLPSLLVTRPGTIEEGLFHESLYLLVNPKKNGFSSELAQELNHKFIRMRGALVYNKDQTMIEVVPKSIVVVGNEVDGTTGVALEELGKYKLTGEIVDSKSFYGALNPGYGKPSRACAVRSVANGVPPLLLIRSEVGETQELIVVGDKLGAIGPAILDRVAVPVSATGIVYRWGNKYVFETSEGFITSCE